MSQEERMIILQMVADKKITAAEAAELLRAIDGKPAEQASGTAAQAQAPSQPKPPAGFTSTPPQAGPLPPGPQPGQVPPPPPFPGQVPPPPPVSEPANLASGLANFIEDVVTRVSSAFGDVVEPRYEFPSEVAGEFAADEVPIRISTGNGRVEVRAWDQPGYKALITVKAWGMNEAEARSRAQDAFNVRADASGFELEAKRWEWGGVAVHVTLWVPRGKRYRTEIRTGNGNIEMAELNLMDARVTTGNGRVVCRNSAAQQAFFRSGNGSMELDIDAADLEVGSGNGSVNVYLTGARSQNVKANTGNGSVRVDTRRLSPTVGIRLDAHTGMGGVNIGLQNLVFDRDVRSMGHKHVVARTANFDQSADRVSISARTGMGSVSID